MTYMMKRKFKRTLASCLVAGACCSYSAMVNAMESHSEPLSIIKTIREPFRQQFNQAQRNEASRQERQGFGGFGGRSSTSIWDTIKDLGESIVDKLTCFVLGNACCFKCEDQ